MKKLILLIPIHCLLFTVYCSLSYSAVLLDRVVATVNDQVITWSELRRNIELENREFLKGLTGEDREKKIRKLEKPFLNSMIDLKLQLQEAHQTGLDVSSSETEGAIADIKKKYNLTDESLTESLKAEGFILEEYRRRLAEQILLSKVVKYKVNDNILITDKEIEEYYEANKEKYRREEKVRIRQIFFAKPEDGTQKANIEAKAEEVMQRIKKGEDFAKIANKFSEDASKEFGGDLGYVSRGTVLKEIEDVVFALKVGEVSKPFWGSTGLHIVKLEDRIEGSNIEEVRDKIKKVLYEKAVKLKYEDWIKGLREKAYIEIKL